MADDREDGEGWLHAATKLSQIHSLPTMESFDGEHGEDGLDELPTSQSFIRAPLEPNVMPVADPGAASTVMGRAGLLVGGYRLESRMSRSPAVEVWTARRGDSRDQRAIKLVRFTAESQALLWDEGRTATALKHPNIVCAEDFGVSNGLFFIVMELVEGPSVLDLVNKAYTRGVEIPVLVARYIAAEVLSALIYANETADLEGRRLALVHRDVSPQNILIDHRGRVVLLDFGAARSLAQFHTTRETTLVGKPGYMSPEQCLGEEVDHRADQFALAVVLWEMLALRALFHSEAGTLETLRLTLETTAPPLTDFVPGLDREFSAAVARALDKDAARRFVRLGDFRNRVWPHGPADDQRARSQLAALISGLDLGEPHPPPRGPTTLPPLVVPLAEPPPPSAPTYEHPVQDGFAGPFPPVAPPGALEATPAGPDPEPHSVALRGLVRPSAPEPAGTGAARTRIVAPPRSGPAMAPALSPTETRREAASNAQPRGSAPQRKWSSMLILGFGIGLGVALSIAASLVYATWLGPR